MPESVRLLITIGVSVAVALVFVEVIHRAVRRLTLSACPVWTASGVARPCMLST